MEGVKELMAQFNALQAEAKLKVLRAAARKAGNLIAKEAKNRIPVGSIAHKTYRGVLVAPGFAKRSIVVKTYIDKRRGTVGAVVGVRAQAFYAVQFVELERGKSSAKGRPWLVPAFEATSEAQQDAFRQEMLRVINKIRKKK